MVQYDIEDDLHSPRVGFVNDRLKTDALRLMPVVHFREVVCMIAVIVISGRVLHDRRDPDSCKTKRFDIIHLLDQPFEIAAPRGVTGVLGLIVPALRVVRRIAVIETRREQEVYLLVTKIRTRGEIGRRCGRKGAQEGKGKGKEFFHGISFYFAPAKVLLFSELCKLLMQLFFAGRCCTPRL